jgi:hypothetical protein
LKAEVEDSKDGHWPGTLVARWHRPLGTPSIAAAAHKEVSSDAQFILAACLAAWLRWSL